MTTQYIFSIETMKACNGNASTDGHYLKWFLQECISRLETAAKDIANMGDGRVLFTADTLLLARARLGSVRQHSDALRHCADWFYPGKPEIGNQFIEAGHAIDVTAEKAERDFKQLSYWLA